MIGTMIAVILILLFVIVIVAILRSESVRDPYFDDGEEVTTHTTTTTTTVHEQPAQAAQPTYDVVGTLTRQKEGNQYYVIDPVDKDKVWLNDTDDMYQDGAGKIWYLK